MPQPESQFYRRAFALAAAGLLGFALFQIFKPFLDAILWGALLGFLLFPANRRLRQLLHGRQGPAALVLTLGVIVVGVIPAALSVVAFAQQARELLAALQGMAGRHQIFSLQDLVRIPLLDRLVAKLGNYVPLTTGQVKAWMVDGARGPLQALLSMSGSVFVGTLGMLVSLGMTLFLLFFILRDGEEMLGRLILLIPMDAGYTQRLFDYLAAVTRAVVLGALVVAIAQGTLVGIAFALVGLPSPVVFGFLAVGVSMLPVVGTALIWVPGAAVLAMQGRWVAAVFLVIWGLAVIASVDNFLRPAFISGRARISMLPLFFGLMGGVAAFGFIGMFLGPVIVALALALLRFAEEIRTPPSADPPGDDA